MTDKLDGLSLDLEEIKKEKLKSVFPECFTEGRLDIDKLLSLCGEYITDDYEKYEFKWKGKSECLRLAQRRSTATLRPCPAESVNFDTTQNLYIEGDNLEVLKLLQKSYFRKVKMIYIDPPYNTGNDFVYEDDFADPMRRYIEVTQQTTKSNPETMGRYHTNWLNMMYPRLRLAANLLRDDGVIFISIDDNEVANLRKLCDEVFGEENFLTQITWEKRFTRSNNARLFASLTDYILVYRKSEAVSLLRAPRTEKSDSIYNNPDNDPRGVWTSVSYVNPATKEQRPNLTYTIVNPITGQKINHPTNAWKYEYEKHLIHVAENRLYWGANGENTYPRLKKFLSEVEDGMVPVNLWKREDVGTTDAASKDLSMLMGQKVFDFPKPTDLIKTMIQIAANDKYSIILDFFSGSATTAHAVMQLNAEDGGNRRFIMVQLPEVCDEKSEAFKAGYKNICEIGKERIRRAGSKILEETKQENSQLKLGKEPKPLPDVGFKVFKLDSSNMKIWDDTPIEDGDIATLFDRIDEHIDGLKPDRSDEDFIFEILLKMGYSLTANLAVADVSGLAVYSVADGDMLICLQKGVTAEHIEQMAALCPQKIVLAERCLADSSAKANAFYLLENRGIELKTV